MADDKRPMRNVVSPNSTAEVGSDLSSLICRQFPPGVRQALPTLVAQPLADGSIADAQFGRELLRSHRLSHPPNLGTHSRTVKIGGRLSLIAACRTGRPQVA